MENRNRTNLLFYIKRTKLRRNGDAPVYLKLTINSKSVEIATEAAIHPNLWSSEKGGAIGNSKEAKKVNDCIKNTAYQMQKCYEVLKDEGKEITAQSVRNAYLGIEPDRRTLVSVFEEHNYNVKLLKGKDYAPATLQRYETGLKLVKQYMNFKYKKSDIVLDEIKTEFITNYEVFLKTTRNCNHNTAIQYLKNLKKIIRIALVNNWMKNDPFVNIKMTHKKVDRGFLSEEELSTLVNKEFSIERLQNVKDCFLFGCFTGLAYSDLKALTPENIFIGDDGNKWIKTKRMKTDSQCNIPILPVAQKILDKYEDNPYCVLKYKLLPVLSNQKLNSYLKEIADLCGIKKEITTHMARHTFATTVTLNNDIPIESVSKMLGHSSINMTKIYARLLDKKISHDMQKLYEKYKA